MSGSRFKRRLYVLLSSGSDGSTALRQLIETTSCEHEARRYLETLPDGMDWASWVFPGNNTSEPDNPS